MKAWFDNFAAKLEPFSFKLLGYLWGITWLLGQGMYLWMKFIPNTILLGTIGFVLYFLSIAAFAVLVANIVRDEPYRKS